VTWFEEHKNKEKSFILIKGLLVVMEDLNNYRFCFPSTIPTKNTQTLALSFFNKSNLIFPQNSVISHLEKKTE
tara:strand:- start:815 stop:1033 length:219 start_codon:yes stop_codon:yes gene_type:complete